MPEYLSRSFLIRSDLSAAVDVPDRVFVEPGSYIALTNGTDEILIVDLTSPRLDLPRGVPRNAASVVRQIQAVSRFTPEPTDIWEATIDGRSNIAKLSRDLVPGSAAWSQLGRIDLVRLNLIAQGRPVAITFLPSSTPAGAGERCLELLRATIPLAKRCRPAQVALRTLLEQQQVELVSLGQDIPTRVVGSPAAPTRLPSAGGVFAVWNRVKANQPVFIVESNATTFRSGKIRGGRRDATSTAAVLDACALLGERVPEGGLPVGLYRLELTGSQPPTLVPAVEVEMLEGVWALRVNPMAEPAGAGSCFLVTTGSKSIVVELGQDMGVDELVAVLALVGQKSRTTRIVAQTADAAEAATWPGLQAAIDLTLANVSSDDGPDEPTAVEVDEAAALLALGADPEGLAHPDQLRLPGFVVKAVAARRGGLELISTAYLRWLQQQVTPAHRVDHLVDFVDALTTYLAAVAMASEETSVTQRQFVVRSVGDWLQTRSRDRDSLPPDVFRGVSRHEWCSMVTRAPWLAWFSAIDPPRSQRTRVSVETMAAALAILRPRQDTRPHPAFRDRRAFPGRWWNTYVIEGAPGLDTKVLSALTSCLETALIDPSAASRNVQGLQQLSDFVRTHLLEWLDGIDTGRTQSQALLAVHVAGSGSPLVLLNGSNSGPLSVSLDGREVRLPPQAVESRGAVDYELTERVETTTEVVVATGRVELAMDDPGIAGGVGFTNYALGEWFRGREDEMARLAYALERHELRPASLIIGPRRAGKSTLAWRLGDDPRAGGRILFDLGSAPVSVKDFSGWNRAMVEDLEDRARQELGVTEPLGDDFVQALLALDQVVGARAPVVVILDEIDVLLVEGDDDGSARRTAGRLGAAAFRNLAVVGTAQRFHHNTHEFKAWQHITCPADLRWADGVTYFLEPLARSSEMPRVEYLERSGASVRSFAETIVPRAGLRPYFWGQLRSRMEGYARGIEGSPRLVDDAHLVKFLDEIVQGDPHIASIFDRGHGLSPEDFQRQDLFTPYERRILGAFSALPRSQNSIALRTALTQGGENALSSLLDRAFLRVSAGERVETAVPLYLEFLRSRDRDLIEAIDRDGLEAYDAGDGAAATSRLRSLPASALDDQSIEDIRAAIAKALAKKGYMSVGGLAPRVRKFVPGPNWAGFDTFTEWLTTTLPDLTVTQHPFAEGTAWRDAELSNNSEHIAVVGSSGVTDEVREAVEQIFAERDYVPVADIANMLATRFPQVSGPGKFSRWFPAAFPKHPLTNLPWREGTVWRDADVLKATPADQLTALSGPVARSVPLPIPENPAINRKVREIVAAALENTPYIAGTALAHLLRPAVPRPGWEGRAFKAFLATVCPELVPSDYPYLPLTYWRTADDLRAATLHVTNGQSETDPGGALAAAVEKSDLEAFDEALQRYARDGVALAGSLTTAHFIDRYRARLGLAGGDTTLTAGAWIAVNAPELALGPQRLAPASAPKSDSDGSPGDGTSQSGPALMAPAVLEVAIAIVSDLVHASPEPVPIVTVGAAVKAAGISLARSGGVSPFAAILAAVDATTDVQVVRGLDGYLWIPGQQEHP